MAVVTPLNNFLGPEGDTVTVDGQLLNTEYWGGGETGTREEPGTLTQGAPVFPGSSRLGIEPKTPGWLVQDPTTGYRGNLIPTIGGSGAHPWRGWDP